jgi:farnesyl diphosphate synthase
MSVDFQSWTTAHLTRFEAVLDGLLPAAESAPQRLHQAMRYAVLQGGKRVRPLLAFAAAELIGAELARAYIAAASVELIHAYSLVHDDMPCMDDDVLRRGKPTCHVQYDEATALLVGDSLQTLAFQLLAEHRLSDDASRQLKMVKLLAVASGSRGMAGGQAIDLASVGKSLSVPELEFMHIHKTGALIRAAILLGAHCGNATATQIAKLDHFGKCVGLAFQVVDDVLDAEADLCDVAGCASRTRDGAATASGRAG